MVNSTITFDGEALFGSGDHLVEPGSWQRSTLERGFGGLSGVVSVDLGRRQRKLKQRGTLSAASVPALLAMTERISAFIDGQAYEMVDQNGSSHGEVRMDSFTLVGSISLANQASCKYEIVYSQLA